ncbi:MAG: aldehyde dehydrogenase family protein [candidate division Zixibacteria bacterium]|nr:aldehyde dehydrogenase family protein [candidate division Zixibacteria bacterium]
MEKEYKMLIGDKWVSGEKFIEVKNKYNQEVIGKVPETDKGKFEKAVLSSIEGFKIMSSLPAYQRAKILQDTSELIEKNKEEFTRIICLEAGKAWKHARAEVERSVQTFKFASEEAKDICGHTVPLDASVGGENKVGFFMRFPVGVIGAISPFNFPLNLVAHKVAPAIAAGCSVILKPASLTPLTSIKLGEIMLEAGLRPGGLNIIFGSGGTVGDWLVTDERVSMITFTGSPPVGRRIKEKSGLKKVTLELGSNSAVIVDQDADLNLAVERSVMGSFAYAGQICISVQRIFLHKKIYESFKKDFLDKTSKLKLGDPLDKTTDVGPMITEEDAKRTESWVDEAVKDGAKILIGGKREGAFYSPTVLENVKPEMKVMALEVFAPVVCFCQFEDFSEAVKMVDNSIYGLQAGVFTDNIENAFQAIKGIKVGGVIINDVPTYRADNMPYGGVKESGIGREGVKFAIEEMTDIKMVCFNLRK